MVIEEKIDRAARDLFEHAIRGELDKIPPVLLSLDDADRLGCLELCVLTAGYVAVDVCGMQWPSEPAVRRIADNLASAKVDVDLDSADVYAYLNRVVIGFEKTDQAFSDPESALLTTILVTGNLLFVFCPDGKTVWEYLNEIEAAIETAASVERYVLPAMIYRSRIPVSS